MFDRQNLVPSMDFQIKEISDGLGSFGEEEIVFRSMNLFFIPLLKLGDFAQHSKEDLPLASDVGRVVIQSYVQEVKDYKIDVIDADRPKTIRLIFGPVSHTDMKLLMRMAEKEMVCTGDQSLSETISCNKVFIYERLLHKTELAESIEQLYGKGAAYKLQRENDHYLFYPGLVEPMSQFFSQDRSESYSAINRLIAEKRNCMPAIMGAIDEFLAAYHEVPLDLRNWSGPLLDIPLDRYCLVSRSPLQELDLQGCFSRKKELEDYTFYWHFAFSEDRKTHYLLLKTVRDGQK